MCFKQGGVKGRSSREEFCFWILFILGTVVCPIALGTSASVGLFVFAASLWGIVCSGPTFTLTVRRFHDVNLHGIPAYILLLDFVLLSLISIALFISDYCDLNLKRWSDFVETLIFVAFPLVAGICLLAILTVALIPGTKGENKYGPPPVKRETTAEDKTHDSEVSQ